MSASDKPAQTGLVDMGVIAFYNQPQTDAAGHPITANQPSFTISDLTQFTGSFSEFLASNLKVGAAGYTNTSPLSLHA